MSQLPEAQAMLQSDYNRGQNAPRGYKTERIRFRRIPHEFLLNLRNRPYAEVRWSDASHNRSFSSYIKKIVIGKTQFLSLNEKLVLVTIGHSVCSRPSRSPSTPSASSSSSEFYLPIPSPLSFCCFQSLPSEDR